MKSEIRVQLTFNSSSTEGEKVQKESLPPHKIILLAVQRCCAKRRELRSFTGPNRPDLLDRVRSLRWARDVDLMHIVWGGAPRIIGKREIRRWTNISFFSFPFW
ncbi:hypothetical protein CDAR_512281 [Caerostris darwini]|uniref:Uncharacterized protein n=1 Tax=Caerostris darwini TaxID=1538125 RepID=A0AAV4WGB4_9ARAC|nr:hypothetical protein CDAR_512281 [Caerostris darwini]